MKNPKRAILPTAMVLAAAAAGGVGYYLYKKAITREGVPERKRPSGSTQWDAHQHRVNDGRDWFLKQDYERVGVESFDGLKLAGYWLPCENAARTVVCVHGYRSEPLSDFGACVRFYHEHGCNLLLVWQRAHGESAGDHLGFGVLERYDMLRWLEWVNKRVDPASSVYLHGISMGCATVLMSQGLKLPENVAGIIADCGYTSPWDEFAYVLARDTKLPVYPILAAARLWTKHFAGWDMRGVSIPDAIRGSGIPTLFIHGDRDDFVPAWMTFENYQACSAPRELVLVPGAGHALSWLTDTARIEERVLALFARTGG